MPIAFTIHPEDGFISSIWSGCISNDEMVQAYQDFLAQDIGLRRYREYADFRNADLSLITIEGLKDLSKVVSDFCQKQGVEDARCASYIPKTLNHSILQLYDYLSKHSPEETRVFNSPYAAQEWLLKG